MKKSVIQDFLDRLPEGAEVAVTGKGQSFFFEGQILADDRKHILISDGQSLQVAAISEIGTINYALPDALLEVIV